MLLLWAEYATAIIIETPTSHIRPLLIKTCDCIPLAKEKTRNIYLHYIDTLRNLQTPGPGHADPAGGAGAGGERGRSRSPERAGPYSAPADAPMPPPHSHAREDIQALRDTSSRQSALSAEAALANFESLFATINKYKHRAPGDGTSVHEEPSVEIARDLASRGMTAALASITVSPLHSLTILYISVSICIYVCVCVAGDRLCLLPDRDGALGHPAARDPRRPGRIPGRGAGGGGRVGAGGS